MTETVADLVWNRACDDEGEGVGDRHLRALLLVHGMVMNGGPGHAGEGCTAAEIGAAAEACAYFGLDELGEVVRRLPEAVDDEDAEEALNDAYLELVPDDATLTTAFESRFATAPADFDPIS